MHSSRRERTSEFRYSDYRAGQQQSTYKNVKIRVENYQVKTREQSARVYKQKQPAEELYQNESAYKKQAIYNWMYSSQQARERPFPERSSGSFKGSSLVTTLISQNPVRFRNRTAALQFAQDLFRQGTIKSLHGARIFEDSEQLYVWQDESSSKDHRSTRTMTSSASQGISQTKNGTENETRHKDSNSNQKSLINDFFKDLEEDLSETRNNIDCDRSGHYASLTPWSIQRASTASSDSSADTITHSYSKYKHANSRSAGTFAMATSRDHEAIPEESSMDRTEGNSIELELNRSMQRSNEPPCRRWPDSQYSYSDNEKQLIEEMKRMKRDHKEIVKSYEDRVTKLMTKMGELRGIAEMLENSGTKQSPYGMLQKSSLLNLIGEGTKFDQECKQQDNTLVYSLEVPPPLPPRPGRGNVVYPNRPIVRPSVKMRPLEWKRIILKDSGEDATTSTIWHSMLEPKIDTEEVERLFKSQEGSNQEGMTLYSDVVSQRGKTKHQLVTIIEREKSGRLAFTMKSLPYPMSTLSNAIATLDVSPINADRFAELMELFGAIGDVDKINAYVKRKGLNSLDHPEYLLHEFSKMEHFRDRVDFLRFRYRTQWQLFEMDQQLRELHTACDEITNSLSLKNLLETLLAVGNYLNGSSSNGQADGFSIDILNKLKDMQDLEGKGNLLEFVMKMYCQFYEVEIDIGCPTRFRLPEPSNMRHAAQVSFASIDESLGTLQTELKSYREKLLDNLMKADNEQTISNFRTTAENFFTSAQEVISEAITHLRETKDVFEKTKAYFIYENSLCNPQEFFQIWAVFLHDCKYYWKLAHRKIAKDRFEFEFKYKGQMSVNSAHGYDSFRASMLRRLTTLRAGIPEQHHSSSNQSTDTPIVNNWTESVSTNAINELPLPQKPKLGNNDKDFNITSSSSPKPLTSEPPASIHKPQPMMNGRDSGVRSPPNYENHDDVDTVDNVQETKHDYLDERPPMPLPRTEHPETKLLDNSKQGPFSIKTWLKREPGRRTHIINETKPSSENRIDESENQTKRPGSSGTTFSKLRSNFVQKITGSSNATKRPNQLNVSSTHNPEIRPLEVTPSFTPLKINTEIEIDPYMTSLGRETRQNIDSSNTSHIREFQSNSAEKRNAEHRWTPGRRLQKARNGSDISTEYAGLYHTPPFNSTTVIDKDGYASPTVVGPFQKSDINNNEKHIPMMNGHDKDVLSRTRAPLALGSNVSISDAFQKSESSVKNLQPTENVGSASKAVHSYASKVSKKNEHRVRLDISSAKQYQIESMSSQHPVEMTPSDLSNTDLKVPMREPIIQNPEIKTKSELVDHSSRNIWRKDVNKQQNDTNVSSKQPEEKPKKFMLGRAYQRQQQMLANKSEQQSNPISGNLLGNVNVKSEIPPQKPPRTPQMQRAHGHHDLSRMETKPKEELKVKPAIVEWGRNTQHQTISSLISRFEKSKNFVENNDVNVNADVDKTNNVAVTSTPVSERRPLTDAEETIPPPLPPRLDQQLPHSSHQYPDSTLPHSNESTLLKTPASSKPDFSSHSHTVPTYLQSNNPHRYGLTSNFENSSTLLTTKPIHSRESTGLSETEGYCDQLRKAASSSVFDRYKKAQKAPISDNSVRRNLFEKSTPYDRQTSQSTNYSIQSSSTNPVISGYGNNDNPFQPNTPQYSKFNQNPPPAQMANGPQRNYMRKEDNSTAIVKPTIVQKGPLAFMEF